MQVSLNDFFSGDSIYFTVETVDFDASFECIAYLVSDKNRYSMHSVYNINENVFEFDLKKNETSFFDVDSYKLFLTFINDVEGIAKTVDTNSIIKVLPNPLMSNYSCRLDMLKERLEIIRNVISGRIKSDYNEYMINGRSVVKININTLLNLEKQILGEIEMEESKLKNKNKSNKILTKWVGKQ